MNNAPLHLFNRVYLETHNYLDNTLQGAVIHPDVTDDIPVDWKGTTLEVSLGENTLEEKIKEIIALDQKYVIYCDNDAFGKIAASWFKSITNMDQESYNKFVEAYNFKRKCEGVSVDGLEASMKAAWSSANTMNVLGTDYSPSIEFLIPTLVHNQSSSWKGTLKKCFYNFIKREYEKAVIDARHQVDSIILDDEVQKKLGGSGKDTTNYLDLPLLQIFKESWWNESGSPETSQYTSKSKIDLRQVSTEKLADIKTFVDTVNSEILSLRFETAEAQPGDYKEEAWRYLSSINNGELTDEDLTSILTTFQLKSELELPYITYDQYQNTCHVFLSYVKHLINTNNSSSLQKYTLR